MIAKNLENRFYKQIYNIVKIVLVIIYIYLILADKFGECRYYKNMIPA